MSRGRKGGWVRPLRHWLMSCLICSICCSDGSLSSVLSGRPLWAQSSTLPVYDAEVDAAVTSGLKWLTEQQRDNGAFGSQGKYAQNVGITALCGMALLAGGHVPGASPYGTHVERCTDYLLSCAGSNGFIVETDVKTHGPMYGHGFATMFLAEVYGMQERADLRDKLKAAVELILASQNSEGGWRYYPVPEEADISVTVCQVMALRAARNKGIAVPREVIDKATRYITNCQNLDGGFRYRQFEASESKYPRSAAALVALFTTGLQREEVMEAGQAFISQQFPGSFNQQSEYYHYGHYYGALAQWHANGPDWAAWHRQLVAELLAQQRPDGAWVSQELGNEYATAMTLIVLQLPLDFVPIFER